MFLLQCLAVTAAAFWMSAFVAGVFLRSEAERAMHPALRVGFGFVLSMAYFSAAWQLANITQAWIAGLALTALYAWGRFGRPSSARLRDFARGLWTDYLHAFMAFSVAALVFFAPLGVVRTFGPFTEGGGDVSIYADTAKVLVDRDLTEFGLPSTSLDDLRRNLEEIAKQGGGERAGAEQSPLMNPPSAEYATYRILLTRTMSPFLYTQFAAYSFLAGPTNYNVYYGLQAFVYAALLAAVWSFFRRYGARIALAGMCLAAVSHGLVSIFYNTYSAQGVALMSCALVLAALAHVRIPSWAALRTYGAVMIVIWITYVHYLSVVVPMALVAIIPAQSGGAGAARERPVTRLPAWIAIAAFAAGCASLAWAGTLKSLQIAMVLARSAVAPSQPVDTLQYMGYPIKPFGEQWIAFLTGILSQQHFPPFVKEYPHTTDILRVADGAALACLAVGFVVFAGWAWTRRDFLRPALQDAAIYVAALLTIAVHLALVRTSLYTQAKGAQNVLLLVYLAMLLPLALAVRDLPRSVRARALPISMVAALTVFVAFSVPIRSMFGYRLALGLDRSAILEPSFFAEAARIRAADPKALILFEPRKSADLYTSNQAFYGLRAVPTRELILQKTRLVEHWFDVTTINAIDVVEPEDIAHLWTLRARSWRRWPFLQRYPDKVPQMPYVYDWRAERLADNGRPALVMTANTFERPYGEIYLGATPSGPVTPFNFMRDGVATLYVPPHTAANVEVELQPREGAYSSLEAEMRWRVADGEFGRDVTMTATGRVVRLAYRMAAVDMPVLRRVARYKGEVFVNVKVDGKDTL